MSTPVDSSNKSFEKDLLDAADSNVESLRAVARHLIDAGGKRVRPRFAALMGTLFDGKGETSQILGAAAEMVHTATLLHDDVIDDSERRRDRPSAHATFGTKAAVLTGDFLLARSLQILTRNRLFEATHELTSAVAELVEGELLQSERAFCLDTTPADSRLIAERKTGALFAWCARAHAVTLQLDDHVVATADRIGRLTGYAFQLADDLHDLTHEDGGKPVRHDLREGRLTVPIQHARLADPTLDVALAAAFEHRTADAFDRAYDLLGRSKAATAAQKEIEQSLEAVLQAARKISGAPTTTENALVHFFDVFIYGRSRPENTPD